MSKRKISSNGFEGKKWISTTLDSYLTTDDEKRMIDFWLAQTETNLSDENVWTALKDDLETRRTKERHITVDKLKIHWIKYVNRRLSKLTGVEVSGTFNFEEVFEQSFEKRKQESGVGAIEDLNERKKSEEKIWRSVAVDLNEPHWKALGLRLAELKERSQKIFGNENIYVSRRVFVETDEPTRVVGYIILPPEQSETIVYKFGEDDFEKQNEKCNERIRERELKRMNCAAANIDPGVIVMDEDDGPDKVKEAVIMVDLEKECDGLVVSQAVMDTDSSSAERNILHAPGLSENGIEMSKDDMEVHQCVMENANENEVMDISENDTELLDSLCSGEAGTVTNFLTAGHVCVEGLSGESFAGGENLHQEFQEEHGNQREKDLIAGEGNGQVIDRPANNSGDETENNNLTSCIDTLANYDKTGLRRSCRLEKSQQEMDEKRNKIYLMMFKHVTPALTSIVGAAQEIQGFIVSDVKRRLLEERKTARGLVEVSLMAGIRKCKNDYSVESISAQLQRIQSAEQTVDELYESLKQLGNLELSCKDNVKKFFQKHTPKKKQRCAKPVQATKLGTDLESTV